jgi:peroxiredoxin
LFPIQELIMNLRPVRRVSAVSAALLAAAVLGCPSPVRAAELGDVAPALSIAQWIKGEPVDLAEAKGKNVIVVEFWATWCGPCRVSIPHLTDLQQRFQDRGVVVIGVSDESAADVQPFVDNMGDKMDYRVALDRNRQTAEAYMAAFGVNGIPHAFVIDREGRIAWHGHPMSGLDQVLDRLAANTFDLAQERKRLGAQRKLQEYLEMALRGEPDAKLDVIGAEILAVEKELGWVQYGEKLDLVTMRNTARFQTLMRDYQRALLAGKTEADLAKIEERAGPLAPKGFQFSDFKAYYQVQRNFQEYYRAATGKGADAKLSELAGRMQHVPAINPEVLNEMAWTLLTDERIEKRDLKLALRFAQAAYDACKGNEADVIDTYARALFDNGKVPDAIRHQRKAIELCNDRERMAELEQNLKRYVGLAKDGAK